MDEENNENTNIISACMNFLQNINYNNQIIQLIVIFMGFFLLLKILGMFRFNINLNQCP